MPVEVLGLTHADGIAYFERRVGDVSGVGSEGASDNGGACVHEGDVLRTARCALAARV